MKTAVTPQALLSLTLFLPLPAQIQPGWGVVSSARIPVQATSPGIWTFDPLFGNCRQLTGLPPSCTPAGNGGVVGILVRDEDGAIVAGTQSWAGNPVEIHVLQGSPPSWLTYRLGVAPNTGGAAEISDMAWRPDGTVVFSYYQLRSPNYSLVSYGLAVLDPTLPPTNPLAVRPIVATGLPNVPIAMAIDPATQDLYVGYFFGSTLPGTGAIYRLPAGSQTASLVQSLAAGVSSLIFDQNGVLLVGTTTGLLAYTLPGWTVSTCLGGSWADCVAIDETTGQLIITSFNPAIPGGGTRFLGTCGALLPIPACPAWVQGRREDLRRSLLEFDPPVSSPFTWHVAPNAGGAPRIGSNRFSLTLTSSPTPQYAFFALAASKQASMVLPFANHVLLSPTQPLLWMPLPQTSSVTLPLRIPGSLGPGDFYAQVFHMKAGVWQGSSGLQIHVF